MKFLLDTNICIFLIKKRPPTTLARFETISAGEIAISSVTLSELAYGVEKSQAQARNLAALREFVQPLRVLPYDDRAGWEYGQVRAHLERLGTPIGPLDMMIGAHARSLDLTLVTNNTGEFRRIPGLRLEDWSTS